jgi:sugar phosphate isomerase/epimerase
MTRRGFLGTVGMAGLTCGLGGTLSAQGADTARIPVGLELYSVRDQCRQDLPGTLSEVGKIGYKGVEFAGYWGRSAKELRAMLDANGMVACGTHTPYDSVIGDKLKETIEFNKIIGNKFLIVPSMSADSAQEWLDKAKLFNEIADKVKAEGMAIGYHAHAHDFKKYDGETAWDLFFGNTKAEVIMQLDTSNCADAGADPVQILKKYPGRVRTIHIKAHGGSAEAVIGEDKLDWKSIFEFCEGPGKTEWYVVEHETSRNPMDAVKRSFEALKKLGKV